MCSCDFVKIKRQMNLFIFSCSPNKKEKLLVQCVTRKEMESCLITQCWSLNIFSKLGGYRIVQTFLY